MVGILLTGGNFIGDYMPRLENSFTKTIGLNSDSFAIFQVALDKSHTPYYNGDGKADWYDSIGIFISLLQVNHNNPQPTVSVRQYISYEDLKELSMLLWQAQNRYESRQKETKEAIEGTGEAKAEAKA